MGVINTGNFISYGNDSHCEFLVSAQFRSVVPVNRNVDLSKNNFRITSWDNQLDNDDSTYKFAPYSFQSIQKNPTPAGLSGGYHICETADEFSLEHEDLTIDCWFRIGTIFMPTTDDMFLFGGIFDGTSRTITGFTLSYYHPDTTNIYLSFICGFPNAGGYYNTYYNLGAYSTFDSNWHHVAGVKNQNYLVLLFDGEVVSVTNTTTVKKFAFDKHILYFLGFTAGYAHLVNVDELRYSKGIARFKDTTTGKDWAVPNRQFTSNNRIFKEITIESGYGEVICLDNNSKIWMWGRNDYGELGIGNTIKQSTPISVIGAPKIICRVDVAATTSFGIDISGRVWSWGLNAYGQLGDYSIVDKYTPVSICGTNKTFCKIAAGYWHTIAIDKNGKSWGWGYNANGQLGNNSTTSERTPVSISTTKTFCEISAGVFFCHGLTNGGLCWGWGKNNYGQLGDNSIIDKCMPVSIYKITSRTFCKIDGGEFHTVAIDKNGKVWGWGYNGNGQLGNNSTTSTRTPVSICGTNKTFCEISAGQYHTVGLDKNGKVWSWGYNGYGQLGDNSTTQRQTPFAICGNNKTFCAIAAGLNYTVAVDNHGLIWAWGRNDDYSQLGMPDVTASTKTPMMIVY